MKSPMRPSVTAELDDNSHLPGWRWRFLVVSLALHAIVCPSWRGIWDPHNLSAPLKIDSTDPWIGTTIEFFEGSTEAVPSQASGRHADLPNRLPPSRPTDRARGEGGTSGAPPIARGTFGPEGTAAVRDFARAFTRAIPVATCADPSWGAFPLDVAAILEVQCFLKGDGGLDHFEIGRQSGPDPAALVELVRRTVALLGGNRFSVRDTGVGGWGTKVAHLRISAKMTRGEPPPSGAGGAGAFGLGFEAPEGATSGRAFFTLPSGRRFEATVQLVTAN